MLCYGCILGLLLYVTQCIIKMDFNAKQAARSKHKHTQHLKRIHGGRGRGRSPSTPHAHVPDLESNYDRYVHMSLPLWGVQYVHKSKMMLHWKLTGTTERDDAVLVRFVQGHSIDDAC